MAKHTNGPWTLWPDPDSPEFIIEDVDSGSEFALYGGEVFDNRPGFCRREKGSLTVGKIEMSDMECDAEVDASDPDDKAARVLRETFVANARLLRASPEMHECIKRLSKAALAVVNKARKEGVQMPTLTDEILKADALLSRVAGRMKAVPS